MTDTPQIPTPPGGGQVPAGLESVTQATGVTRAMLIPPLDLPIWMTALAGLLIQLQALLTWFPQVAGLIGALSARRDEIAVPVPPSQAAWAISHHIGTHPELYAAIETHERTGRGQELRPTTLALFATWGLRVLLGEKRQSAATIAKARRRAELTSDRATERQADIAEARALSRSLKSLHRAMRRNPALAASYGLRAPAKPRPPTHPIAIFNRRLRIRRSMLMRYARKQERAGSRGHGGLTRNDLERGGEELLAAIRAGDTQAIMAAIQVRTELDANLVQRLPVQLGLLAPPGALAWIDLTNGTYSARLDQVTQKGRRPGSGIDDLYETTTQITRLALMAPLMVALLARAALHTGVDWLPMGELLGAKPHGARAALAGSGPYRATARKFQRSLGGELLARGHCRWPAALATQQATLLPESHEFYSALPAVMVDAANRELHHILAWPIPTLASELLAELIGSHVTLTMAAVPKIVGSLVATADAAFTAYTVDTFYTATMIRQSGRGSAMRPSIVMDSVIKLLNSHAAYLACILALCLALRDWNEYQLSPKRLSKAYEVHFAEKQAHLDPESAVPVVELVRGACAAWLGLLDRAVADLMKAGDVQSRTLAEEIQAMQAREDGTDRLFLVGSDFKLHPVGHKAWTLCLPKSLRVAGNVFRHFWPLRLSLKGLHQLLIDVLLRHQLAGLHEGSEHIVGTAGSRQAALRSAMEEVLHEMHLPMPHVFAGTTQ